MTRNFTFLLFLFLLFSCSSSESSDNSDDINEINSENITENTSSSDNSSSSNNNTSSNNSTSSNDTNENYPNFIDAMKLRIFAKEGVSTEFLQNVGKTYEAMLAEGENIDESMRTMYLNASEENYVYQRVGLDGSQAVSNFEPGDPPAPFVDNATDFIWQMEQGGADQIGEVVEHLLHTVTNVILYLSFPEEWDYNNPSSQLSLAMQESIDKGIYDISDYNELLDNDPEIYKKILTQEYAYWLILAEWDYYVVAGKKEDGISGNGEFTIGTPAEILETLPLGHELYKNFVEKILTEPDKEIIVPLFQ